MGKILILVSIYRAFVYYPRATFWTGIYLLSLAGFDWLWALALSGWKPVLISAALNGPVCWLTLWLMRELDSSWLYWVVMLLGLIVMVFFLP